MKKKLEITAILLFILSLLPILGVSFFSHPVLDDYTYSRYVHEVMMSGNPSPVRALAAAIREVRETYVSWQGTFSAVFLFAFQPGVYPTPCYWLTAFIIIGSLVASSIYFWVTTVKTLLQGDREWGVIIALLLLTMQIQFVPDIKEAFYWFNGCIYYSFFFSLFLVELGLLAGLWTREHPSPGRVCALSLIGFIIGGGNYSTALINSVILLLVLIAAILRKHRGIFFLPPFVFHTAAFLLSITAPGNSARGSNLQGLSAVLAIWKSLTYAGASLIRWTGPAQIGCFLLLLLLFLPVIKSSTFSFRYPLPVIVLLFGLFAAQATPPFYAMANEGGYRQVNMYYYSYYHLMALALLYVEGWCIKKWAGKKSVDSLLRPTTCKIMIASSMLLILTGSFLYGLKNISFFQTYLDLKSGRALRYHQEYQRFLTDIENSDGIVYTSDINEWPSSFYRLQLTAEDDIGYWVNDSMARYFGVEKILLSE